MEGMHDFVDYFPAFEIISSTPMRAQFYEPDLRNVSKHGVAHVMTQFFSQHLPPADAVEASGADLDADEQEEAIVCDEAILASFGADA
jgi:hypothetical protein